MGEPSTISCYWCSSPVQIGVRVSRGCNADVVYAATRRERTTAAKWGMLLGIVLAFVYLIRGGGLHGDRRIIDRVLVSSDETARAVLLACARFARETLTSPAPPASGEQQGK